MKKKQILVVIGGVTFTSLPVGENEAQYVLESVKRAAPNTDPMIVDDNSTPQIPFRNIETILRDDYGVSVENCTPLAILWATDKIHDTEIAKAELKRVNEYRAKIGRTLAYPDFGHRLF
jgi:hypothetical protein